MVDGRWLQNSKRPSDFDCTERYPKAFVDKGQTKIQNHSRHSRPHRPKIFVLVPMGDAIALTPSIF
jgi:hypothetical protein